MKKNSTETIFKLAIVAMLALMVPVFYISNSRKPTTINASIEVVETPAPTETPTPEGTDTMPY